MVHGQRFNLYQEQNGWCFGQAEPLIPESPRKGYVGWVNASSLEHIDDDAPVLTHRVTHLAAPVFAKPDLKTRILQSLPLGSRLSVTEVDGNYCNVGDGKAGWMHVAHLKAISDYETDWVDVARNFLGQPYVWGGNGARGLDCSGLVQMSLDACGIDAPRDADMQEDSLGERVDRADKRGDLLFWPGHVGILSAPGQLLHANATHMSVVEEPLESALERIASDGHALRSVRRISKP